MPDPVTFSNTTSAIGLPLLVPGQAQKEFFVNQAMCLIDALFMRIVKASQPAPPASPDDGECFRITAPATGVWSGRTDRLAVRIGGDWHYIEPSEGMQLFDQTTGQALVFRSQWLSAITPALPEGGLVIDVEAREAISGLLQVMQTAGILRADVV